MPNLRMCRHSLVSTLSRWSRTALVLLFGLVGSVSAAPTVLDFEDRSYAESLAGISYGGLNWEAGNPGLLNMNGRWTVPGPLGQYYPHSGTHNAVNAFGSTLMGIGFPSPVNMAGAYIAGQGGNSFWAWRIKAHGYLAGQEAGVTDWFEPIGSTPGWFDMSLLSNVDRIIFEVPAVFQNEAYYGIDDLTFTAIPEPASLGLVSITAMSLLSTRRRARSSVLKTPE